MIKLLIKRFIKDHQNITDIDVRESYSLLSGFIGIACNALLFLAKVITGLLINSIAVISDAFNNLSDLGSSLIIIFAAKLGKRPPDPEHPHGHGRYEYIATLIVSFIIFAVGLELLRGSFGKVIKPEKVIYSTASIIILVISIIVKIWMFFYNGYIGGIIDSSVNRATALDSLNDAVATSSILIGTLLGRVSDFPFDGIMGIVISVLIMYTGFSIAKDSVNLLLGSSPDPELIKKINSIVFQSECVRGTHDLKIHDYGPGKIFASIHAEISYEDSITDIHSEAGRIQERIKEELGIDIVIHMDPAKDS
ncbi:MAG: cation transporter [Clostridium sp.]|nr:cation transporter [Clostridium sp.]